MIIVWLKEQTHDGMIKNLKEDPLGYSYSLWKKGSDRGTENCGTELEGTWGKAEDMECVCVCVCVCVCLFSEQCLESIISICQPWEQTLFEKIYSSYSVWYDVKFPDAGK